MVLGSRVVAHMDPLGYDIIMEPKQYIDDDCRVSSLKLGHFKMLLLEA